MLLLNAIAPANEAMTILFPFFAALANFFLTASLIVLFSLSMFIYKIRGFVFPNLYNQLQSR